MADDPKKSMSNPPSKPPIASAAGMATRRTVTGAFPIAVPGAGSRPPEVKASIAEALRETQDAVQEAVRELTGKIPVPGQVAVLKPTPAQMAAANAAVAQGAQSSQGSGTAAPAAPAAQAAPSAVTAAAAAAVAQASVNAAPAAPTLGAPSAGGGGGAAPTPPEGSVTIKVDGREVTVKKGTNVLEACLKAGTDISYFCYHPGLSSPAVCRQCLVEVSGQPKLVPSCYTPVADKMEIITRSPRVDLARQQMLEFTLVNHPVDCPICDKAGECTLQKLYMDWDGKDSRTAVDKVHKPKAVDLGPHIVLDAERCILCTRCIRVCDEVAGVHQLEFIHRGDHEMLTTAPGQQLDNPYSLNTVDVCPVGALTSKDFRFRLRAWELYTVNSICPGCSTGCNVEIHHGQGEIWRLVPRENQDVNKFWMCDEGRFTYKQVRGRRIAGARIGQGRGLPMSIASVEKAITYAAQKLGKVQDEGGTIGVVFGAQVQNEALYALDQAAELLAQGGAKVVRYLSGKAPRPERQDKILRTADVNPNSAGARVLGGVKAQPFESLLADLTAGKLKALWLVGEDTPLSGEAALAPLVSALDKLELFIVQAVHDSPLTPRAQVLLPAAAWAEVDGTFTNKQGHVQRLHRAVEPPGDARSHLELVGLLCAKLGLASGQPWQQSPRQAFHHMVGAVRASLPPDVSGPNVSPAWGFSRADWGREAPPLQLRFANSRG